MTTDKHFTWKTEQHTDVKGKPWVHTLTAADGTVIMSETREPRVHFVRMFLHNLIADARASDDTTRLEALVRVFEAEIEAARQRRETAALINSRADLDDADDDAREPLIED